MIGAGNSFYLFMIIGPLVGVFGTVATQFFAARLQKRTTAGTVATSNANELWQQAKWTIERQDKAIEALGKRIDELLETVRRLQADLDKEREKNEELVEKVHLQELELVRLRAGQAVAAAQTPAPTKVTVETPGPVTVARPEPPAGSD